MSTVNMIRIYHLETIIIRSTLSKSLPITEMYPLPSTVTWMLTLLSKPKLDSLAVLIPRVNVSNSGPSINVLRRCHLLVIVRRKLCYCLKLNRKTATQRINNMIRLLLYTVPQTRLHINKNVNMRMSSINIRRLHAIWRVRYRVSLSDDYDDSNNTYLLITDCSISPHAIERVTRHY